VLQNDRGITYTADVPAGSRVVAGRWWSADETAALVSLEKRIADDLGLKLGDEVVVNVLGRNITAHIANLRTLDWQSLGINFVFVFSPATFRGAPHTDIATLTYPNGGTVADETALLKTLAQSFPAVTAVSVREALNAAGTLIGNLVSGIRGASAITLLAAVLVLGGALAAGHRHRVYDAVVLKTLGATRLRLVAAYALEYLLLGSVTALFGMAAGTIAAWVVVTRLMNLPFTWLPAPAIAAAFCALLITVALGLVGTARALGQKPAGVLRNL
jgi:putative ABC transport system permease protein